MKKKVFVTIVLGVLLFVIINTYSNSRKEFLISYNFEISKIVASPTKSVAVYKGEEKVYLWNFSIRENDDIRIGDVLVKGSCSEYLFIYL
ncbi:cell shape-determining protein MreC [Flavobacterium sp. HSC-61S13]|nr:cell shape-determining protein MreC [Flavobacterium sp. HSC-61S13]